MSYNLHNFYNGQILTAQQLNEMDVQIQQNDIGKASLSGASFTGSITAPAVSVGEMFRVDPTSSTYLNATTVVVGGTNDGPIKLNATEPSVFSNGLKTAEPIFEDSATTKNYVDQKITDLKVELGLLDQEVVAPEEVKQGMVMSVANLTQDAIDEDTRSAEEIIEQYDYNITDVSKLLNILAGMEPITDEDIIRYNLDPDTMSISDVSNLLNILSNL